jgi:hypothetical protein
MGPKKQDFWPRINIVCQLGIILENKVVKKLKLENNVFTKKRSPKSK